MAYDYSKLTGRIIEKFGTRKRFAEELGLSEVSMSNKLNGKSGFSQAEITTWGKTLGIAEKDFGLYFFYPCS